MAFETASLETRAPVRPPNRLQKLDAINQKMIEEINEVLDPVENDEAKRTLVLTGAGR